jgi:integrase
MASVWGPKQLPSGAWRIRWRASDGSQPSKTYPTRGEAARAARELAAKIGPTQRRKRAPGPQPPTFLTIDQIAQQWRDTREGTAIAQRPGADAYMDEVTKQAPLIAEDLGWTTSRDANPTDVANLKRLRRNRGVARPLSYLRVLLRWAAENAGQPLDFAADVAMRAPQSRKSSLELLTDREAKVILSRARRLQQLPIISCLITYGWRPITACRLKVGDVDLRRQVIRIGIKQHGEPWEHDLFPGHVEQLAQLVGKRAAGEPLFLNDAGTHRWWPGKLGGFYRHCLKPTGSRAGNIYALKRLAMTRMHRGLWPWPEPLSIADIQLFTGHKTKEQVFRYLGTNRERSRFLVRGARGADGAPSRQGQPPAATADGRNALQRHASPADAKHRQGH